MNAVLLCSAFLALCGITQASNILILSPLATSSHLNVFRSLAYGLVARGHSVTHVAPKATKNPPEGYKTIVIKDASKVMEEAGNQMWKQEGSTSGIFPLVMKFLESAKDGCRMTFQHPDVRRIIEEEELDLIFGKH